MQGTTAAIRFCGSSRTDNSFRINGSFRTDDLRELHIKARSSRLQLPIAYPLPGEDGHSRERPKTLTEDTCVSHQRGVEQDVTPHTRR